VLVEHGITLVVPENRRINQDILVTPDSRSSVRSGEVVTVEIIEQPGRHSKPIGRIVEVLGNYADPGMEIEIALRKHELPFEFSKQSSRRGGAASGAAQAFRQREEEKICARCRW
jgi:ribonuclease R